MLITGRDILNLWVSRMIATSLDFIQTDAGAPEIPFHQVFVHPTIQDTFGQRMSKSLGTGIDPLELIETYGADATRYGLLQLAGGAQDTRFTDEAMAKLGESFVKSWQREHRGQPLPLEWSEQDGKPTERYPQMQAARNFANKIWNAARFVLSFEPGEWDGEVPSDLASKWINSRLNATVESVTRALDKYEFESAASTLYAFVWGDLCDWFLETSKPQLRAGDAQHAAFLAGVLERSLRLLHPFMPFISEEIWAQLPKSEQISVLADTVTGGEMRQVRVPEAAASILARAPWPQGGAVDAQAEADFALIQDAIRATRNLRAQADIAPGRKLNVTFIALAPNAERVLRAGTPFLTELARLETVSIVNSEAPRPDNALSAALPEIEVWLPLEGLIDVEKERAKLEKQLETASKDLEKVSAKLGNAGFVAKAPPAVIAKEKARRAELGATIESAQKRLAAL